MSVGAKMIAAHDEILLTCSFCCRLTSVCRRATSAECTVSEWMRRAGEPDELARQLVDHPAEHGVEHSLRAEREQLRVLREATPHRTHVGRLRVPDRDQEVGPREQVQLACASPAGCRSRRGCGASPPGGRPRRWRCRSGSWSSPLRTSARIAGAREDRAPGWDARRCATGRRSACEDASCGRRGARTIVCHGRHRLRSPAPQEKARRLGEYTPDGCLVPPAPRASGAGAAARLLLPELQLLSERLRQLEHLPRRDAHPLHDARPGTTVTALPSASVAACGGRARETKSITKTSGVCQTFAKSA